MEKNTARTSAAIVRGVADGERAHAEAVAPFVRLAIKTFANLSCCSRGRRGPRVRILLSRKMRRLRERTFFRVFSGCPQYAKFALGILLFFWVCVKGMELKIANTADECLSFVRDYCAANYEHSA